jgi:type IV pilus assembly protein PilB
MTSSRLRLGQLLVDAGMITQDALEDVLAAQRHDGRRLGMLLVERGHISEVQLTQILSHQLSIPWVSLLKIEFSRQLLNLVPREVAERYCLLPILVRRVRGQGETLYIAMDDPSNEEALKACSQYSGLPVRPMIAPPGDIRNAIRAYYGLPSADTVPPPASDQTPALGIPAVPQGLSGPAKGMSTAENMPPTDPAPTKVEGHGRYRPPEAPPTPASPLPRVQTLRSAVQEEPGIGVRLIHAERPIVERPVAERPPADIPPTVREPSSPPPPPRPGPERLPTISASDPVIEIVELPPRSDRPPIPAPVGKTPRMVSLTLLDGTTLSLPARPQRKTHKPLVSRAPESSLEPSSHLTARDLVAALRAVADGADASAVLGDDLRWETMFAALLSLMLKKQLIADWEFVAELNKFQKR